MALNAETAKSLLDNFSFPGIEARLDFSKEFERGLDIGLHYPTAYVSRLFMSAALYDLHDEQLSILFHGFSRETAFQLFENPHTEYAIRSMEGILMKSYRRWHQATKQRVDVKYVQKAADQDWSEHGKTLAYKAMTYVDPRTEPLHIARVATNNRRAIEIGYAVGVALAVISPGIYQEDLESGALRYLIQKYAKDVARTRIATYRQNP